LGLKKKKKETVWGRNLGTETVPKIISFRKSQGMINSRDEKLSLVYQKVMKIPKKLKHFDGEKNRQFRDDFWVLRSISMFCIYGGGSLFVGVGKTMDLSFPEFCWFCRYRTIRST
jgi:hypothetical protein